MHSIRARLQAGLAAATIAAFAIASGTTYLVVRSELLHEYDDLLGAKARTLAMLAEPLPSGVEFEFQEHGFVDFTRAFEPEYYEAWDDQGEILADSGHARDAFPPLTPGSLEAPRFRFVVLPDGRPGRMIAVRFDPVAEESSAAAGPRPPAPGPVTLIVARDTLEMNAALRRLAWTLLAVFSATVAAVLALLGWIVSRGLRPLSEFARQIGDINEIDLAVRLSDNDEPEEMRPVINGFNGLLERLEEAFDRERTFSSNVAHELRTPLAGLLATIQVALSRDRHGEEYRTSLRGCEAITLETHRLVETLLLLTRIESGKMNSNEGTFVVDSIVAEVWQAFVDRAEQNNLVVAISGPPGVRTAADRDQMAIVLANLFDNAVEYTCPGGTIDVSWRVSAAGLLMRVANGRCDIAPEQIAHVFDRFWRGDASRTDTGAHAGLGLALSKRIVIAAGGQIQAALEGEQFVVTIAFDAESVRHDDAGQLARDAPFLKVAEARPA